MKKPKYILDSYALLAYFKREPEGAKVRTILNEASDGHAAIFMSVISLGEIYYIIARKRGKEKVVMPSSWQLRKNFQQLLSQEIRSSGRPIQSQPFIGFESYFVFMSSDISHHSFCDAAVIYIMLVNILLICRYKGPAASPEIELQSSQALAKDLPAQRHGAFPGVRWSALLGNLSVFPVITPGSPTT